MSYILAFCVQKFLDISDFMINSLINNVVLESFASKCEMVTKTYFNRYKDLYIDSHQVSRWILHIKFCHDNQVRSYIGFLFPSPLLSLSL